MEFERQRRACDSEKVFFDGGGAAAEKTVKRFPKTYRNTIPAEDLDEAPTTQDFTVDEDAIAIEDHKIEALLAQDISISIASIDQMLVSATNAHDGVIITPAWPREACACPVGNRSLQVSAEFAAFLHRHQLLRRGTKFIRPRWVRSRAI